MRYAIFTDVHANLEALEAVLTKIDELHEQESIDHIWFLGDLVGYGPNPNECIDLLRTRTDVILAGNHDWAAVGKLDLDDFSPVARISAEWTTKQLTDEHTTFLQNLPERIFKDECTLVHGSPYGPLWEYLTSEALAERSFQYFDTRYCFVGHTHVPVIFQQPDPLASAPTVPLASNSDEFDDEETQKLAAVHPITSGLKETHGSENMALTTHVYESNKATTQNDSSKEVLHEQHSTVPALVEGDDDEMTGESLQTHVPPEQHVNSLSQPDADNMPVDTSVASETNEPEGVEEQIHDDVESLHEQQVANADAEVEELLALLGLSQSLLMVTNEMIVPPIGEWNAPQGYRAIVNPGGVGQPRDGNPEAAFMIFDTEKGFTFYRVPYDYEKTQKKILDAGLPPYLAARLEYGR
jgi:diadenosine tetraphosphatase ApaH/serine/threonine PP2A family protein phosphatase